MSDPYSDPQGLRRSLEKQRALGMLGMMSGDSSMASVGKMAAADADKQRTALSKAMEARQITPYQQHVMDFQNQQQDFNESKRKESFYIDPENPASPVRVLTAPDGTQTMEDGSPFSAQGLTPQTVWKQQQDLRIRDANAKSKGNYKKMTSRGVEKLIEAGEQSATVNTMINRFKPEIYGSDWGMGVGTAQNALAHYAPQVSNKLSDHAVEKNAWWEDWNKHHEMIVRHGLFGAALTAPEIKMWRENSISPNLPGDQIQQRLGVLKDFVDKKARMAISVRLANGTDPKVLWGAFGDNYEVPGYSPEGYGAEGNAPAGAPGMPTPEQAAEILRQRQQSRDTPESRLERGKGLLRARGVSGI
jgi:hypothetical protein